MYEPGRRGQLPHIFFAIKAKFRTNGEKLDKKKKKKNDERKKKYLLMLLPVVEDIFFQQLVNSSARTGSFWKGHKEENRERFMRTKRNLEGTKEHR